MLRDAQLADLIDASPCILTKYQLGENEDADPEWRATAVYSRDELTTMISDERIPPDRQMVCALEGIGALRHGEAAGLRFRHDDPSQTPLGRFVVATSYAKGRTKTTRTRYTPVHPTLAAMLDAWKAEGWVEMMGRRTHPPTISSCRARQSTPPAAGAERITPCATRTTRARGSARRTCPRSGSATAGGTTFGAR